MAVKLGGGEQSRARFVAFLRAEPPPSPSPQRTKAPSHSFLPVDVDPPFPRKQRPLDSSRRSSGTAVGEAGRRVFIRPHRCSVALSTTVTFTACSPSATTVLQTLSHPPFVRVEPTAVLLEPRMKPRRILFNPPKLTTFQTRAFVVAPQVAKAAARRACTD